MRNFNALSENFWPKKGLPKDVFEYYTSLEVSENTIGRANGRISGNRMDFLDQLEWDHQFSKFWNLVQEMYPEKEDYFVSLMNEDSQYNPDWLQKRYNKQVQKFQRIGEEDCAQARFRFRKKFEEMPREEKRNLIIEFENLRPNAYQFALKAEAQRLNCDLLDVRPKSLVLPLEHGYDPRLVLAELPDEILSKTLHHLDSLDVFRMTLVCRRWKSLVYNNCAELKRAEHAVTTHLITFTDWMDPSKTPSCKTFERQFCQFGWGLVSWYCGISSNLETLIMNRSVSYSNVAALLKSCPNLKNLQLGRNSAYQDFRFRRLLPEKVHLPNLEVYLCNENYCEDQIQQVKRDILCSAESLRVLRVYLADDDMEHIQFVRPMTDVFCSLTALDLTRFSENVLQLLSTMPDLQLKYLSLGRFSFRFDLNDQDYEIAAARCRDAFHQLLPKLWKLEVLETLHVPGITNETVQLLTDLDLNLQFAFLGHSDVRLEPLDPDMYDGVINWMLYEVSADPLDPSLLIEFRDRLLLRNPELDLSNFHFAVAKGEARDQLLAADIGFSIACKPYEHYALRGLCYPAVRNRLNINF